MQRTTPAARPRRSRTFRARQIHRYLGLTIGIQFILWTAGGLYFSWTDLDEVHGDHLAAPPSFVHTNTPLASPSLVLERIRAREPVDSVAALSLQSVLGRPVYRLQYFTHDVAGERRRASQLADARTGELRPALQREEAVRMARAAFLPAARVQAVEWLTAGNVGAHHEYREQPLPAWAVNFTHPSAATVYVAAEAGAVQRIRHRKWRIFDFLWMLHTMDYAGRDNFNNLLLRAFSLFGLATVLSGFVLFGLTSRPVRQRIRGRAGVER